MKALLMWSQKDSAGLLLKSKYIVITLTLTVWHKWHSGKFGTVELAQISEKFKNNPKTTLILGGDFNAGGINWDLCTVDHDTSNRTLKEKLLSILSKVGLKQMQKEPTRGQNLLDLFCCNKPSLVKSITSIPGISDHNIVLADCKLKPSIITKLQRKIYQWSKAD